MFGRNMFYRFYIYFLVTLYDGSCSFRILVGISVFVGICFTNQLPVLVEQGRVLFYDDIVINVDVVHVLQVIFFFKSMAFFYMNK